MYSKWYLIGDIYNAGIHNLYRKIRKRCSHRSPPDNHSSIYFQNGNGVFFRVSEYKSGQNFVYRQEWPHRGLFNPHEKQRIVGHVVMQIFKIKL